MGGDAFADLVGELADDGPDGLLGIVRHEREVEADSVVLRFAHDLRSAFGLTKGAVAPGSVVGLGELEGLFARADFGSDAVEFVVEDVAEALGEDEGEDVVLVFRRVLGPADGAGSVTVPGFERFVLGRGFRRLMGRLGHRCSIAESGIDTSKDVDTNWMTIKRAK